MCVFVSLFAESEDVSTLKYITSVFLFLKEDLVEDSVVKKNNNKKTAMIEAWHVWWLGLHPPLSPDISSMLVPAEEGQSEAWDLKVLGEAKMPADLDWTD